MQLLEDYARKNSVKKEKEKLVPVSQNDESVR